MSEPPAQPGSRQPSRRLAPAVRRPCGSRPWPPRWGCPRAASTGTSRIARRCSTRCSTTGRRRMVEDVIATVESKPVEPRAKLQQLFELASTVDFAVELALRDWSRRDREVADAPAPDRQPADGVPALAVRAALRRRERRRGPQHAGLLALHRQLLHRRQARRQDAAPRCCSWRSTGCSASHGLRWPLERARCSSTTATAPSARSARTPAGEDRAKGGDRRLAAHRPGRAGHHRGAGRRCRAVGRRSTARSARDTRRLPRRWRVPAGPGRIAGRAILLPGISSLAAETYRLVAANRYRLPGSTPACDVDDQRRRRRGAG